MEKRYKLNLEQTLFLEKAYEYWKNYSGGIEVKASFGVVQATLRDKSYNEKQRVYLGNVRAWYIHHH